MRIGVFAKIFPGTRPDTVLNSARDAGFAGVQYNMVCSGLQSMPDSVSDSVADAVTRAAADAGITIEAISATYNMIHPDPNVRRQGLHSLEAIASQAHTIGTRLLTLCNGTRDPIDQWRYHSDNETPEAWSDLISACHDALRIAEAHDIDLGVEPERANVISSATQARRLIDELGSPRIKIVLDPANLVEGMPPNRWRAIVKDSIDLLAGRIVLAHAKDRASSGKVTAPGNGAIDFSHLVDCLHHAGYDGSLVAHGFTAGEAQSVARFLSSVVDNAAA